MNNILTIKNDLKTYFEKKTEGAIIRSKACWLMEGERNSKCFFNLERRNYINSDFPFCIDLIALAHSSSDIVPSQDSFSFSFNFGISASSGKNLSTK
jgi:hypothetical protein